jgi:hypothetical protein
MLRSGNSLLGALALANLVVFTLFAGVEPASARWFEECDTECCFCIDPGPPELDPICSVWAIPCDKLDCLDDSDCARP